MSNITKKLSWLTPAALFVALPASAIHLNITETIDNPGFEIVDQFVEVEDGLATEFEVAETWTSATHPSVQKLITIDYQEGAPAADLAEFEFEFKVTNDTASNWSSYSFSFDGLGDLNLSDVLVSWENELEDIDDTPVFFNSEIIGNTLRFDDGAHLIGDMVSYELYFDLETMQHAGINELATVQAVPLPAAAWLMIGGLGMLVGFAKKRNTA